jgi:glycolate oxidase iron-sulfur subunit
MHHQINPQPLGPHADPMIAAVQACVHCGFCLPTCPTYQVLGQEMDSPRGRIFLMKEVLEGKLAPEEAQPHIDRCLGCLACQTHCPSGVKYGELLSPYRAMRRQQGAAGGDRLRRWLASMTLPYPTRFRWAMRMGKLGRRLRPLVPKKLRPMVDLVPPKLPAPVSIAPSHLPSGTVRGRVALLTGCAQQVLAPEISIAAIEVLNRNGFEVIAPTQQGCCGALSWHIGDLKRAKEFAINNIAAFDLDVEAVLTTAAGCGSALHEYPLILAGTEHADASKKLAKQSMDISVYLIRLNCIAQPPLSQTLRIAYHDACHLSHGQGVRDAPRNLLRKIKGVELIELAQTEICCGSAGTYNLDQPDIANQLGREKAQQIIDAKPDIVALGNIGCLIQIRQHLQELGYNIPVLHTVEILQRAYRGTLTKH